VLLMGGWPGRLFRRPERGSIGQVDLPFVVILAGSIAAVVGAAAWYYGFSTHPRYTHEAAQRLAEVVATKVRQGAVADPTTQAYVNALGVKTWTQTVTVQGAQQTATITVTPQGGNVAVDVSIPGDDPVRVFASLMANGPAPGQGL
jgi:hypothetical protein